MDRDTEIEIEEYRKKLAENPSSLIFLPLAELFRKNGLYDEALETCSKGLAFHPDYISARLFLAKVRLEKNMPAEAEEELRKITEIDPDNIMAHTLLEGIYRQSGSLKLAKAAEEKINSIASTPPETSPEKNSGMETVTMAEVYFKQGLLDEAMVVYEKIVKRNPLDVNASGRLQELRALKEEEFKSFREKKDRLLSELKELRETIRQADEQIAGLEKEL